MKKEFKPYIIAILIIIIVAVVIYVSISALGKENQEQDTYVLTTDYQDEFIAKEIIVNTFPDICYDFELYESNRDLGEVLILKLQSVEKEQKEVIAFYIDNNIKCYLVSNNLIFKTEKMKSFQTIQIYEIKSLNPREYKYLIPVAQKLFLDNWESARDVSEFLVKCNDTKTINLIKKYSKGDFSNEEVEENAYSIYSKTEMQEFCTEILKKYGLK